VAGSCSGYFTPSPGPSRTQYSPRRVYKFGALPTNTGKWVREVSEKIRVVEESGERGGYEKDIPFALSGIYHLYDVMNSESR
jgi:hypothetical protein